MSVPVRRYTCDDANNRCVQQPVGSTVGTGMSACRLMCDPSASLWPLPTGTITLDKTSVTISTSNIFFSQHQPTVVKPLVDTASQFFLNTVKNLLPPTVAPQGGKLVVNSLIKGQDIDITLQTDESYVLQINRTIWPDGTVGSSVGITANTFFGFRHGLETLSQMMVYDEVTQTVIIRTAVAINDAPKFPYRGILLDTSRQFVPLEYIKHLIDSMSYNKLNYFHWHITDTSSFPFESISVPEMTTYGAFAEDMVYTQKQISELVFYGLSRGVRVIPELDEPAHTGNGWQWGPDLNMGDLGLCINLGPWQDWCLEPPCGQLNPVNPHVYDVLGKLFLEMHGVFQKPTLFHIGGDEVKFSCWNNTPEILTWLEQHNMGRSNEDFLKLWGLFQQQAYTSLKMVNQNITPILWTSDLVNGDLATTYVPPSDYIIEVWDFSTTSVIPTLLDEGYRLIVANADAWYLDCGFGGWVTSGQNWCSPYKEWQLMYDNRPYSSSAWNITDPTKRKNILGGEACLWAEEADAQSMDSRIWPRSAAVAERLWSDPQTGWLAADDRMQFNRARLVSRGVAADALQPLWCLQNQGLCTLQSAFDVVNFVYQKLNT